MSTRLNYFVILHVVVSFALAEKKSASPAPSTQKSSFEDKRCKCICPAVASNGTILGRSRIWIRDDLEPSNCNCYSVLEDNANAEVCPLCVCQYESRNTAVIKIVVIFIICVVSMLFIYMCFLLCLDPWITKRPRSSYQQHVNEEDDHRLSSSQAVSRARMQSHPGVSRQRSVINRVTDEQKRWKDTVQEQRKQIYDQHSLLN